MLRGDTNNKLLAAQARDFTGLVYGNISPTDLDGMIEFHNKCYVLFEAKYAYGKMREGQQIALERFCDDLKKPSILILAIHSYEYPAPIRFANCKVDKYRLSLDSSCGISREWRPYNGTVKELTDWFIGRYGK